MTVYKRLVNFESAYVDTQGNYVIYGLPQYIKKGDTIYCDMCMFKDEHTYIRGTVIKRYKYKAVLNYEYIDYL